MNAPAPAPAPADAIPIRVVAERLHRLAIEDAWGRLRFDRASDPRPYHDLRRAAARRQLVLNLDAARHPAPSGRR